MPPVVQKKEDMHKWEYIHSMGKQKKKFFSRIHKWRFLLATVENYDLFGASDISFFHNVSKIHLQLFGNEECCLFNHSTWSNLLIAATFQEKFDDLFNDRKGISFIWQFLS